MNTGGSYGFDDFVVKCVVAQHSSSLPDGSYGGNPMGFIIYTGEGNFYYSGDTALTLEMQLIPKWAKLNFAVLPIGDNFTICTLHLPSIGETISI
jgi:L-ascorbate metabolism protein UlaG (beta-lactamase superfamily)